MRVGSQQRLASRSSAFAGARPLHAAATTTQPECSRRQLQVSAKGKQRMRTGGNRQASGVMQPNIPVPPVDPDNEEFVIFVRSKKLPQWMPLSVVKGGTAANLLVKSLENDIGKKLYGSTLVNNIAQAVYKDRAAIERSVRGQFPMFKAAKEFEYGFKIRDKTEPKSWYQPKDVQLLPPESELEGSPLENMFEGVKESTSKVAEGVTGFLNNLGSGFRSQS